MKATEARKYSIKCVSSEIDEIKTKIIEACMNGYTSISLFRLSPAAENYFKQEGYDVRIPKLGKWNCEIRWSKNLNDG